MEGSSIEAFASAWNVCSEWWHYVLLILGNLLFISVVLGSTLWVLRRTSVTEL